MHISEWSCCWLIAKKISQQVFMLTWKRTKLVEKSFGEIWKRRRGNLVKSVIHVSRGHWKTKIPKCWKSYCFGYLVPAYTASDEKKTTGHLIAPFTNLLCLIQRIPMSPRDAYFVYHVFMLQVTCILHKSVVIDAIKIEFVYVRLSNGIVVFI